MILLHPVGSRISGRATSSRAEALLRVALSPAAKVPDLKGRFRCRGAQLPSSEGRFVLPAVVCCAPLPRHARNRRTVLEPTPPQPSTSLLSALEAKDRLREIVEGFFFRLRSDQGQPPARHLLVRSPPGLGKTKEAMEWATRYQTEQEGKKSILHLSRSDITPTGVWAQVAIFVPRHELAREVKEVIERNREDLGAPVEVPVLRGRDNEAAKDNAPCRRWGEARELGRKGLPVYSNLCRRRHQREISELCARQMRCTEPSEMPMASAIARPVQ
jgi:hypothetical protein